MGCIQALVVTSKTNARTLEYDIVSNEYFIGHLLDWLARHATYLDNPEKLPKHSSALDMHHRYLNTTSINIEICKSFAVILYLTLTPLIIKLKKSVERQVPKPFHKDKWSKHLLNLTKIKAEHHFKTDTPMFDEKETATTSDRISITTVSILEGTAKGADFFHFINTTINVAGRGSSIASAELKDIYTEERTHNCSKNCYLAQKLNHFKTRTISNTACFHTLTNLNYVSLSVLLTCWACATDTLLMMIHPSYFLPLHPNYST